MVSSATVRRAGDQSMDFAARRVKVESSVLLCAGKDGRYTPYAAFRGLKTAPACYRDTGSGLSF